MTQRRVRKECLRFSALRTTAARSASGRSKPALSMTQPSSASLAPSRRRQRPRRSRSPRRSVGAARAETALQAARRVDCEHAAVLRDEQVACTQVAVIEPGRVKPPHDVAHPLEYRGPVRPSGLGLAEELVQAARASDSAREKERPHRNAEATLLSPGQCHGYLDPGAAHAFEEASLVEDSAAPSDRLDIDPGGHPSALEEEAAVDDAERLEIPGNVPLLPDLFERGSGGRFGASEIGVLGDVHRDVAVPSDVLQPPRVGLLPGGLETFGDVGVDGGSSIFHPSDPIRSIYL